MILTLTPNPCIDKSTSVERLEPEIKMRCSQVLFEPGGGGINVSKALKELGTQSVTLFPSGGHNGNMLCSLLKEENIPFRTIATDLETRENWIVKERATRKQYRFTFPGNAISSSPLSQLIPFIPSYSPSYVIASGSLPPGIPINFFSELIKQAQQCGAKSIIDTSGPALPSLRGKKAFLMKPNLGELAQMVEKERLNTEEIPDVLPKVIEEEYAEWLVVSMGAAGAWLAGKGEQFFCPAPEVEIKSTVGAGDSMVAGIIFALEQSMPFREALLMGVACGTAATLNEGTQLFKKEDALGLFNDLKHRLPV